MTDELREDITAPLVHDMRGALGVIRLATQLLEETAGASTSHARILNACRRLAWHLDELDADLGLRNAELAFSAPETLDWAAAVSERLADLAHDQPRRVLSFVAHSRPQCRAPVALVLLVLNGLVDSAAKTTASKEAITVSLTARDPSGLSLEVTAERSELRNPAELPFRLNLARALSTQLGGTLQADWGADKVFRARLDLPA